PFDVRGLAPAQRQTHGTPTVGSSVPVPPRTAILGPIPSSAWRGSEQQACAQKGMALNKTHGGILGDGPGAGGEVGRAPFQRLLQEADELIDMLDHAFLVFIDNAVLAVGKRL